MNSFEVRKHFLNFFESKQHTIVSSAPMVIKNDPTLMFTNAGMNQFKDIFLGNENPKETRVADTQKCLRVSGKHNDLEEVGVDTYHHTMFEMLGNWSFGDYYKKEAIEWAWELLTEIYKIDRDRLYITVFEGDDEDGLSMDEEGYEIWKNIIDEDRIIMAGKKDNFWEMGETGPCGPCSEIHVDIRSDEDRRRVNGRDLVNNDHPQVIEIWNLVFMELNRTSNRELKPLPAKHIDTGMGFERLNMVLQKKESSYDTDVFSPLISYLEKRTKIGYTRSDSKKDIAIRVISDHVRAVSFAIADGQLPSNTGAGYVIRRILRRALRYGYSFLNLKEPFIHELAMVLIDQLAGVFTELQAQKDLINRVIKEEEESFLRTLERGISRINELLQQSNEDVIAGKIIFELYDTYGFPIDLTALILSEHNRSIDEVGFYKALEEQKDRSRKASAVDTGDWSIVQDLPSTEFVGYDTLKTEIRICRFRQLKLKDKEIFHLVFDKTPFYPEGGGQVGDTGIIENEEDKIIILNTKRENNLIIHEVEKLPKSVEEPFIASVNEEKRSNASNNHSATHLLHLALRKVLGNHVEQKGSLVNEEYLRFDFSHFAKLSMEELRNVEFLVNSLIRKNIALEEHRAISREVADEMGAMALFGEKYGDKVRVIKFGESVELCGGIHVKSTGNLGLFKITGESAVAAGVRRIEANSGESAERYVSDKMNILSDINQILKGNDPLKAAKGLLEENSKLNKEIEELRREKAGLVKKELQSKIENIGEYKFLAAIIDLDMENIKNLCFQLKEENNNILILLATSEKEKATLSVALSNDLVNANKLNASIIIRNLAKHIKGGGGGQPFFATAGGKNPSGIESAFNESRLLLNDLG